MKAYCQIRSQPHYRRDAFVEGLKQAGYQVSTGIGDARPGDVLVIWNRYADNDHLATKFEKQGGTVLVAENGYLDPGRDTDRRWYALAIGGHNGQGEWRPGGPERWAAIRAALGAELKAWRQGGDEALICPNRSFGRPGFVMPFNWAEQTARWVFERTGLKARIRPHPGNGPAKLPNLQADLARCRAVVIWSSSAGVHALLEGVPVICSAPAWICKAASHAGLQPLLEPIQDIALERHGALERLAWAQWHVEEIARGEPFRHLLPDAGQVQGAAAM